MFQGTTLQTAAQQHLREGGLKSIAQVLNQEMFDGLPANPVQSGTVLVPEVVFWLMACVALGGGTMAAAITMFWATVGSIYAALIPLEPITAAAFCTARKKLPLGFFSGLFSRVVDRFDEKFGQRHRWKGFHLCGIDGTLFNLPRGVQKLLELFGCSSNELGAGKHPQALLVGIVDLWSGVCRGFSMVSSKVGETTAALSVIPFLGPQDLLLGDRVFPCFPVMARTLQQASQFLMRLKGRQFKGKLYPRKIVGVNQWLTTIKRSKDMAEKHPDLPEEIVVRIIQYQIAGFQSSYLITSLLDANLYPWEDLLMLYHERWRHETAHRNWKHVLTLSNLRSKSEEQLRKEVFVQLTLNNAVCWIMAEASGAGMRPIELSFLKSKRLVLAAASRMAEADPKQIPAIYRRLLNEVREQKIKVRRGRHYARRKNEGAGRNKGHGRIAKAARLPPDALVLETAPGYIEAELRPLMVPDSAPMTI